MSTITTDDPLALERQVCFALSLASRSVVGAYKEVLDPMHLTHPQYLVMLALWEESPLSVKALSARLALEPATISPLLKRLESLGYIARTRDKHDERALAVELTERGTALREQAVHIPEKMKAKLGLSDQQLGEIHAAMISLVDAAQVARDKAPHSRTS